MEFKIYKSRIRHILTLGILVFSFLLSTIACNADEHPLHREKRSFHEDYEENVGFKFRSDGNPSNLQRKVEDSESSEINEDLMSIGCFDSWINNPTSRQSAFDMEFTVNTCSLHCQELGLQLSLIKGGECLCKSVQEFQLFKIADSNCNVVCPASSLIISSTKDAQFCGGNRGYSVYCWKTGAEDCASLESQLPNPIQKTKIGKAVPVFGQDCAMCTSPEHCYRNIIWPDYDYFPANEPEECAKFCGSKVTHAMTMGGEIKELERPSKKYALLLWDKYVPPSGSNRAICQCLDDLKDDYVEVGRSACDTPCPGNHDATCGNNPGPGNPYIYVQIYYTTDGSNADTTPTVDVSPVTSTTEMVSTTTPEITSTTMQTTSTSTVSSTTTTISTTTTTESPSTTTEEPTTTATTTVEISTERSTTPPPPPPACQTKCQGVEFSGRPWSVCAGEVGVKDCNQDNSTGNAVWHCLSNGDFETPQPDYSGCRSNIIEELERDSQNVNDTNSALEYLIRLESTIITENSGGGQARYFGHEISNMTNILANVVERSSQSTDDEGKFAAVAERTVGVTDRVITTAEPWHQLSQTARSELATKLIQTIETTSIHLTSKVELSSTSSSYERPLSPLGLSHYMVIAGASSKVHGNINESIKFPPEHLQSADKESVITLPSGWKHSVPGEKVDFVGMFIDSEYANLMMPGQFKSLGVSEKDKKISVDKFDKVLNGNLMAFALASTATGSYGRKRIIAKEDLRSDKVNVVFPGKGVQISFAHDLEAWGDDALQLKRKLHKGESPKAALGSAQCVFWDTKLLEWSTKGCKIIASSRHETVCECNHLTSFAVLMDVHNYTGKELGLEVLTLILCSLSFICLFASIVIFSTYRGIQSERTSITKNLAACLLVGNTMVLLVVDRNYFNMSEGFCVASGIITHYVFLSAFAWMAIEGVHLYRMVVHVFDSENSPLNLYRVISYGLPLLVVVLTVMIGYLKGDRPYGSDVVCWLDGNYIWSFLVPVLLIVLENFIILFIALKTAYQLQHNPKRKLPVLQNRVRSFRTWMRGCFALTVLLGLTWLIGFFTLVPDVPGTIAAYFFVILNASQGIFIFLFHCLFNDKIRVVTYQRFGSFLPSWISSSLYSPDQSKRNRSQMKSSESDSSISTRNQQKISTDPRHEVPDLEPNYNKMTRHPESRIPVPISRRKSLDSGGHSPDGAISIISPGQNKGLRKRDSCGTLSSIDSLRAVSTGSMSDSGMTTDNSLKFLLDEKTRVAHC